MNAINHAATALLIKKYWPDTPLVPALVSVQLIEVLWVVLNIVGWERTEYTEPVHSLANIHLVHMPFSHSLAFTLLIAAASWALLRYVFKRPSWAWPLAIGVFSHIVLDLITHARDIEIIPFLGLPELGTGLYLVPVFALMLELVFVIFCWWVYGGSRFMLGGLLLLNMVSVSIYVPQLVGPEVFIGDFPEFFPPVLGLHILFGWVAVWYLVKREESRVQ